MSLPLEKVEEACVGAALEMIEAVSSVNKSLSLRVGIAAGPLIGMVFFFFKFV
jgi:hypothetical protein